MSFENKYLFFLCALGVFNCVLASCYFLFIDKRKRPQNVLFGVLALVLSIKVGKTLYMAFGQEKNLVFAQIGLSASFLIGVSLYYYLRASLNKIQNIPKAWKWHFAVLFFFIVGIGFLDPYPNSVSFWNDYLIWFIYIVWGGYLVLSGFLIKGSVMNLLLSTRRSSTLDIWLVSVFIGNLLIFLAYIIGYYWLYLVEMLTFSFVFYALLLIFLVSKNREVIFKGVPEKYGSNKIGVHEARLMQERLGILMDKEELFKDPNLKLQDLAERMNVSHHKLSQFLNDNLGTRFSSFINGRRIAKAIQLLNENNQFTLEAIGYESGFSTKSVFYSTFKKVTGKTPSTFRNEVP